MLYAGALASRGLRRPARRALRLRSSHAGSARADRHGVRGHARLPPRRARRLVDRQRRGAAPFVERHGRWCTSARRSSTARSGGSSATATGPSSLGRVDAARALVRLDPGRRLPLPLRRATSSLTLVGSAIWAFALAGLGWAFGEQLGELPQRLPLRRLRRRRWSSSPLAVGGSRCRRATTLAAPCRRFRSLTSARSTRPS